MTALSLLPKNATPVERAVSLAADPIPHLAAGIGRITTLRETTPHEAAVAQLKVLEYGLGPLTSFVPDVEQLLEEGVTWQRLRGTPAALVLGLAWLATTANLEEAPIRRRRWNLFQLALGAFRANEVPDLFRIEGLAGLSVALRSQFFRGFHGYDVRSAETSWRKTSGSLLSNMSGARIPESGALWSFGRSHDHEFEPTEAELTALGVWVAPSSGTFTWQASVFPWDLAAFAWGTVVNTVRRALMAALLARMSCWVEFKTAAGVIIGYRRVRAHHQAVANSDGPFAIGATRYAKGPLSSDLIYSEALTDFGEGHGQTAATAALRFGASPINTAAAGALWLGPALLATPFAAVGQRNVTIAFGRTSRERVRTLLRITA